MAPEQVRPNEREVAPFTLGQATEMEDKSLEVSFFLTQAMSSRYVLAAVDVDELGQSFVMKFKRVGET